MNVARTTTENAHHQFEIANKLHLETQNLRRNASFPRASAGLPEYSNPILDTRISVRSYVCLCVTLRGPPLKSETGWTGELWSNPVLLILEN